MSVPQTTVRRIVGEPHPYAALDATRGPYERGRWPCRWIGLANPGEPPFVAAYRCRFDLAAPEPLRVHVSADERYTLYLDGSEVGRGPERGAPDAWPFETYEIDLAVGGHVFVARVWSAGPHAPRAQMSVRHGFLLAPQAPEHLAWCGTGQTVWEGRRLEGWSFERPFSHDHYSRGSNLIVDAAVFPWGFETGGGAGWEAATTLHEGLSAIAANRYGQVHLLVPATLPAMQGGRFAGRVRRVDDASAGGAFGADVETGGTASEADRWQRWLDDGDGTLEVAARTRRRVLVDFGEYRVGTAHVTLSGGRGARLRLHWAESLYTDAAGRTKGHRGEVAGKYFLGVGDTFLADGGARRVWTGCWTQAGRYALLEIDAAGQALRLESIGWREERYPLRVEAVFTSSSEPRLEILATLATRTLRSCCLDAFVDGPYYEQMTWVGDTRLQALAGYSISADDRLARKALALFDRSRLAGGLTRARYPARDTMLIAPYSLWWIGAVHDFARWRGDRAFVRGLLPGVRAVLAGFGAFEEDSGLVAAPPGWNFVDWVPGWPYGVPPGGDRAVSSVLNWQYASALAQAAELERWLGEPRLAAHWEQRAVRLARRLDAVCWDAERGLYRDGPAETTFSEHAQCLAILSGKIPRRRALRMLRQAEAADDVARATIYFSHYLFEACARLGMGGLFGRRLRRWFAYAEAGLTTLPESPEPTRSDCHGWGAHILYHLHATLLGVRPDGWGFERVSIAPLDADVPRLAGSTVHPRGLVSVELYREGDKTAGRVELPEGITGTIRVAGRRLAMPEGRTDFELSAVSVDEDRRRYSRQ